MTNKINGIDVSECEKLGETIDGFTCGLGKRIRFANEIITKHNLCKDNPDCYFKQLKRIEQINSELISKANAYDKLVILANDRLDIIDRLKQENEKLKENQCCLETCEYIATEIIRYTNVCEVNLIYKQAFEKIRNIAKKLITETPEYNSCYYKDECGDNCTPKKQSKVEYCCYENVDKILTIINEVIK